MFCPQKIYSLSVIKWLSSLVTLEIQIKSLKYINTTRFDWLIAHYENSIKQQNSRLGRISSINLFRSSSGTSFLTEKIFWAVVWCIDRFKIAMNVVLWNLAEIYIWIYSGLFSLRAAKQTSNISTPEKPKITRSLDWIKFPSPQTLQLTK